MDIYQQEKIMARDKKTISKKGEQAPIVYHEINYFRHHLLRLNLNKELQEKFHEYKHLETLW